MPKYKVAVFDMDGTILNTLADLTDSVNYALSKNGYPTRTIDEVKAFVGNGIGKLCERAVPKGARSDSVLADFKIYYSSHSADKTVPYEGIEETMKTLKENGVKIAVVTNKADKNAKVLIDDYFPSLVDVTVGEREGIPKKPNPEPVHIAIKELGEDCLDAVYIGDSDVDALTAQNSKLPFIGVTWGFRTKEVLINCGAKVIVNTAKELTEAILGSNL